MRRASSNPPTTTATTAAAATATTMMTNEGRLSRRGRKKEKKRVYACDNDGDGDTERTREQTSGTAGGERQICKRRLKNDDTSTIESFHIGKKNEKRKWLARIKCVSDDCREREQCAFQVSRRHFECYARECQSRAYRNCERRTRRALSTPTSPLPLHRYTHTSERASDRASGRARVCARRWLARFTLCVRQTALARSPCVNLRRASKKFLFIFFFSALHASHCRYLSALVT